MKFSFYYKGLIFLVKKFPNTFGGMILGIIFGSLITAVPFIGWILSYIIMPISILLGGFVGFYYDVRVKLQ
jgi:hypothetical protein